MSRKSVFSWSILLVSLFCRPGFSGGFVGNGVDDLPFGEQTAWFGVDRPIRYCLEISKDFGVAPAEIEQSAVVAFETWRNYATLKRLTATPGNSKATRSFDTVALASCDGSEDLQLLFGIRNETVDAAMKLYFNPLGFANRTDVTEDRTWSKGFIWIKALSQKELEQARMPPGLAIRGLLLHELGHVFGNGHVPGTIMDPERLLEAFSDFLPADQQLGRMTSIDQERELYLCSSCDIDFSKELSQYGTRQTYQYLMGRPPLFPIKARLIGSSIGRMELILSDSMGEVRFPISNLAESSQMMSFGGPVFALSDRSSAFPMDEKSWGYNFFGSLTAPGDRTFHAMISRNMKYIFDLQIVIKGQIFRLFSIR